MQHLTCVACGVDWSRPPTRGRVPKLCPECRETMRKANMAAKPCGSCGSLGARRDGQFCGRECFKHWHGLLRCRVPATHASRAYVPPDPSEYWTPLRTAYVARDRDGMRAALEPLTVADGECLLWQRRSRDGYPTVRWSRREHGVHRVVAAVFYPDLRKQPVHHRCAVTMCVRPEHLQPVTQRENVAEMLARHAYLNRIAELERALADVAPDHPLIAL